MKRVLLAGIMIIVPLLAPAQSERSLVNRGNDMYEEEKFDAAEIQYRKALKENEASLPGRFNLGNSLHKQGKYDQSVAEFETAASSAADSETRSKVMYNRGNSLLEAKQYDAAIASYREALKQNPGDQDAKYNLSYALLKRQQQQQDQQEKKNQDKNNQQNKPKNQEGDQKQDPKDNRKNQPPQEKPDEGKSQQGNEGENPPPQMSRADAERILQVLKDSEKEVQKKLRAKRQQGSKSEKDW